MMGVRLLIVSWLVTVFAVVNLGTATVFAQDYGDTPYVQTPQVVVDKMLELAKVSGKDYLIDLGSGDGRMIITAAKRYGAHGFGVDLNKSLVTLSNRNAVKMGVANRAVFYERDLHDTDLTQADVITTYLLPEVNLMVRPRLLALKPGTRIVSHDYGMGEWPPDVAIEMDAPGKPVGRDQRSKVLFWIVPTQVAGKWVWQGAAGSYELQLEQVFQKITGTLSVGGRRVVIDKAVLSGEHVSFEVSVDKGDKGRHEFSGKVINNAIEGDMRVAGAAQPWNATRTELRDARLTDLNPGITAR
ncbi:MAG TPA: methyltransferase domain-containing protein [Burkholderiales bacterium]|nr:methyltransferase domain-containing protein [Burkholderiales bacterium]